MRGKIRIALVLAVMAALLVPAIANAQTYEYEYYLTFDSLPQGWDNVSPYNGACADTIANYYDTAFDGSAYNDDPGYGFTMASAEITSPITFGSQDLEWSGWGSDEGQSTSYKAQFSVAIVDSYPDCSVRYLNQAVTPDNHEVTYNASQFTLDSGYIWIWGINTRHYPTYMDSLAGYDYMKFTVSSPSATDPFTNAGMGGESYGYWPVMEDLAYEVNHVDGYGPIVDDIHTEEGVTAYASFSGSVVFLQVENGGYTVKILDEMTDRYAIYSNLQTVYPRVNDTVTAGCMIGTVGASFKATQEGPYTQNPGLLWYYTGTDFYDFDDNEYIDWQEEYDPPSDTGIICGSTLRTDHCINYNPHLDELASGWIPLNIPDYELYWSSVHFPVYMSSLSQYMVLDHTQDYYVTITYELRAAYDMIALSTFKGTTSQLIDTIFEYIDLTDDPALQGTRQIVEIGPIDLTDYDSNDIYLITLSAALAETAGSLWIDDICIHEGDATVSTPYCYFDNYQIDGPDGWDSDGDFGNNPGTYDSSVILSADEYISQAISLSAYDDDDCDYALTIGARVTAEDLGDLVDIFTTGWSGDLAQEVWSAGPSLELDIGDVTIANAIIFMATRTEFTVDFEDTLVGDLTITADSGNTKDINIDYICIEPVTGIWPGSGEDIVGNGRQACDACHIPTGVTIASLPAWIDWLWCNLSLFFTCTLANWINAIGIWLRQTRDLLGLFGRYLAAVIGLLASWWLSVLEAFAALLRDLFYYVLSLVWNAIAALDLLQLLYDTLGYLIALINGLYLLGAYAFDLVADLFRMLLTIGHLIGVFFLSVQEALSGSVPSIALPSCESASTQTIEAFCIVLEIADGIFDEFTALTLALTLDAALLGFVTIVWSIRKFGSALGDI